MPHMAYMMYNYYPAPAPMPYNYMYAIHPGQMERHAPMYMTTPYRQHYNYRPHTPYPPPPYLRY